MSGHPSFSLSQTDILSQRLKLSSNSQRHVDATPKYLVRLHFRPTVRLRWTRRSRTVADDWWNVHDTAYDPVCRGCDQSQCTQFGRNEVSWNEIRWGAVIWVIWTRRNICSGVCVLSDERRWRHLEPRTMTTTTTTANISTWVDWTSTWHTPGVLPARSGCCDRKKRVPGLRWIPDKRNN